jgi:hypothetical protein
MGTLSAVAVLAQEGHFLGQELRMVASMGHMADQTILHHRDVLPHKRPSLFRMAFEAELIDGIRSKHFIRPGALRTARIAHHGINAESTHRIVAAGASERLPSNKRLIHGMMGLLTYLRPNTPMAVEAEERLGGHQQLFHSPVDGMAASTRIARKLVPIHIPECHGLRLVMAGQAF